MSFWITIVKRPRTKAGRADYEKQGFIDLPELNVMIGEHSGIDGIGGFIWDPDWVCEEVPEFDGALNASISGKARELLIEMVRLELPEGVTRK